MVGLSLWEGIGPIQGAHDWAVLTNQPGAQKDFRSRCLRLESAHQERGVGLTETNEPTKNLAEKLLFCLIPSRLQLFKAPSTRGPHDSRLRFPYNSLHLKKKKKFFKKTFNCCQPTAPPPPYCQCAHEAVH